MDTFIDKLASKFNAQEMIRANAAAEARENERLEKEVDAYKQCLQEMREINLQNVATADEVAELVKEVDRISTDTEYNTKKLLDGSSNVRVYGENGSRYQISDSVDAKKRGMILIIIPLRLVGMTVLES